MTTSTRINVLIDIPDQIKDFFDLHKADTHFADLSDLVVFAHNDINYNVKSGLYINFLEKRESNEDDDLHYIFELLYMENIANADVRDIISRKRIQSIDRLLCACLPASAIRIEALSYRRMSFREILSSKPEVSICIFTIEYILYKGNEDYNYNP